MAKGPRGGRTVRPLSLRGLYGGERLDELRAEGVRKVRDEFDRAAQAGAEQSKLAALAARIKAREDASSYSLMIRQFRKDVSQLRKQGFLPPEVKATSAVPTRGLLQRIENLPTIARGEQRAVKIPKGLRETVLRQGVEIRGGKALLSPEFTIDKKGELQRRNVFGEGFVGTRRVYIDTPRADVENRIKGVFNSLGKDEYVTIQLGESNHSMLFNSSDLRPFLERLMAYLDAQNAAKEEGRSALRYVTIVRIPGPEADSWIKENTRQAVGFQRERYRQRDRERRQRKKERAGIGGKGAHLFTPKFPGR